LLQAAPRRMVSPQWEVSPSSALTPPLRSYSSVATLGQLVAASKERTDPRSSRRRFPPPPPPRPPQPPLPLSRLQGWVRGLQGSDSPFALAATPPEDAAHAGGSSCGVAVLPPGAFFPSYDPMQQGSLRDKCSVPETQPLPLRFGWLAPHLHAAAAAVCSRLAMRNFAAAAPPPPPDAQAGVVSVLERSFADHRWAHTWLGAELVKVDLRDTIGVDDNGRFRLPGINPR